MTRENPRAHGDLAHSRPQSVDEKKNAPIEHFLARRQFLERVCRRTRTGSHSNFFCTVRMYSICTKIGEGAYKR